MSSNFNVNFKKCANTSPPVCMKYNVRLQLSLCEKEKYETNLSNRPRKKAKVASNASLTNHWTADRSNVISLFTRAVEGLHRNFHLLHFIIIIQVKKNTDSGKFTTLVISAKYSLP